MSRLGKWTLGVFAVLAIVGALGSLFGEDEEPIADPVDRRVPDVVGMALDDAKDKLRDVGFRDIGVADAIEDRMVIVDGNWEVVSQGPNAGRLSSTDTRISLRVAKFSDNASAARSSASPSRADPADVYVAVLQGNPILDSLTRAELVQLGREACSSIDIYGGVLEASAAFLLLLSEYDSDLSETEALELSSAAGQIIGAAVPAFCPQHQKELDEVARLLGE